MPVIILISFVIKTHFHGGEFEITVSNIAFAIGMIAGSMILYIRNFKTHKAKIEMWSYAFFWFIFYYFRITSREFFLAICDYYGNYWDDDVYHAIGINGAYARKNPTRKAWARIVALYGTCQYSLNYRTLVCQ